MYEKILELIREKEITFAELSRQTGIAENVFSNLKSRGGMLSVENAARVADYFGVRIDDLL